MREIVLKGLTFVPYIDAKTIGQAVKKLGERLKADFKDRDPLFVCIMNGSFMFASDAHVRYRRRLRGCLCSL